MYLFERWKDRESVCVLSTGSPPKYLDQPGWGRPRPGAANSLWVFCMGAWLIFCCLRRHVSRKLNQKLGNKDSVPCQSSHCGMLASQVGAYSMTPQSWYLKFFYSNLPVQNLLTGSTTAPVPLSKCFKKKIKPTAGTRATCTTRSTL